tara:strand:+ start:240 stop:560 length:321 start_codon:yes stop_codon:yes gene_type:complete
MGDRDDFTGIALFRSKMNEFEQEIRKRRESLVDKKNVMGESEIDAEGGSEECSSNGEGTAEEKMENDSNREVHELKGRNHFWFGKEEEVNHLVGSWLDGQLEKQSS